MTRKIQPIASGSATASTYLAEGARWHSVKGECSTKPTYDFTVTCEYYTAVGGIVTHATKYVGTPNGKPVSLWNDFPQINTTSANPAAQGQCRMAIIPGTGVVLQYYYLTGTVPTA